MAFQDSQVYREKAAEMRAQAERAETPYLRGVYEGMAQNWALLADYHANRGMIPPRPEGGQQVKL